MVKLWGGAMKRVVLWLVCAGVLCVGWQDCVRAQNMGDGVDELPMMTEWRDPDGLPPPVYEAPKAKGPLRMEAVAPQGGPRAAALAAGDRGRVAIVVENGIYNAISVKLTRYRQDLVADGYTVLVNRFSSGTAEALKAYLQGLYGEPDSLNGAVFIGDLPHVIFEYAPGSGSSWPCDIFFMDMDGTWSDDYDGDDPGTNGKYDTWDHSNLDIWMCRWRADNLPALGGEILILNNYFDKNHDFRQLRLTSDRTSLLYADDDWWWDDSHEAHAWVYGSENCTRVNDKETTSVPDYLNNQLPQRWDQIHVLSHGSPNGHQFKTSEGTPWVRTSDYRDIDPPALFYNLFICSSSTFLHEDNLGSTVTFNDDSGLLAVGSTKAGSMIFCEYYYDALSRGMTFGDAFVFWFNKDQEEWGDDEHFGWHAGMVILGDATLRPSPKMFTFDVSVPREAREGDGVLADAGRVGIPYAMESAVIVSLASSDETEVRVPTSVTIPVGQTSATFNVTIVNDGVEDLPALATVTATATGWSSGSDLIEVHDPSFNERGSCLGVDRYHNDWASIAHSASIKPTGALTVEAWAYEEDWTDKYTDNVILSCTQNGGYSLRIDQGGTDRIVGSVRLNGQYYSPAYSVSGMASGWHHFALTCDGRYVRLYVDGELRDSRDAGATYPIDYDPDNSLILGGEAGGGSTPDGSYFNGRIDELRIWQTARTQHQVRDYMHRVVAASTAGLGAYYRFDLARGSTVYDETANDNDGTLHSAVLRDSTTPFSGDMAGLANLRAAWIGMKTPSASGRMAIEDGDIAGLDFVAFAHNAAAETQNTSDKPAAAEWRLNRVWRVDQSAASTVDLSFDVSGWAENFVLLSDADGTFADASLTLGSRSGDSVTFTDIVLQDGYYYTLASVELPGVTTAPVTDIAETTAQSGGEVTSQGGGAVTARGVCWSTMADPTTDDDHMAAGSGLGAFSRTLTGLIPGQPYYLRAYASNVGGTAYGATRQFRTITVPPGKALDFDGNNDYVEIGDHDDLDLTTIYTLECWFRADSFGGLRGLIDKYQTSGANGYLLRLDGTELDFDGRKTSGLGLTAGVWYHAAAVNSSGTRTLYVNGRSVPLSGSGHVVEANTNPLRLASDYSARYFDGSMDEVRIWNTARSEAEVRDCMHKVLEGDESGLVAYYPCDSGVGTALPDASAHGHGGTLKNGPLWIEGTMPCAVDIADRTDIRGFWPATIDSLGSGRLVMGDGDVGGDDYAVFGHDDAAETMNTTDKPVSADWRLNRAWTAETRGEPIADIRFDTTGFTGPFALLVTTNDVFADASVVSGISDGDSFTAPGVPVGQGCAYTLAGVAAPQVTTAPISNVTYYSAWSGGEVTAAGGSAVTSRGLVWSRAENPTLETCEGSVTVGAGTGAFSSGMEVLVDEAVYYVRAFASNSQGTGYGQERSVRTYMAPPGNCLTFDGNNDYVAVPHHEDLKPTNRFTVCVWAYRSSWSPHRAETIVGCTQTGGYSLVLDGDQEYKWLRGYVRVNDKYLQPAVRCEDLAPGWHHFALKYNGEYAYLYIDGKYRNARHDFGNYPVQYDPDNSLVIGAEAGGGTSADGQYFTGKIDEVSIWNVSLSGEQIYDLIHRELSGSEEGLVAYYNMGEKQGSVLPDLTGNGHDGALVNGPNWVESTFPCARIAVDSSDLSAVWSGRTPSDASGRLTLKGVGLSTSQNAVFGHDNQAESTNVVDTPGIVDWRNNRVWRADANAAPVANFTFDTAGFNGPFALLVDDDGVFADATTVSGLTEGDTFSSLGVEIEPGSYFTFGRVDLPVVTTASISNKTHLAAMCGGDVTDVGASAVTTRGIVWDTAGNPSLAAYDGIAEAGSGPGSFAAALTGLAPYTTYYVRAYASNSRGTGYGQRRSLTTGMTPPGYCLDFSGVTTHNQKAGSYGEVRPALRDEVTFEAWVRLDDAARDCKVVCRRSPNAVILGVKDGRLYPEAWDSDGTRYSFTNGLVRAYRWTHLAMTYKRGDALVGYINGEEVGRTDVADLAIRSGLDYIYIAVGPGSFSHYVDGRIDEVRVWHVARTGGDIRDNMHRELTGDEAGLSAYYNFNHTSGDRLDDLTPVGSSYANIYERGGSLVWRVATRPCAAVIADRDNLRAIWSERTNSLSSSILTIRDGAIGSSDSAVVGHNGGAVAIRRSDMPEACMWRLDRTWATEDDGVTNGVLRFDCSDLSAMITHPDKLRLLRDGDGVFADASPIEGVYHDDVFTVSNQSFMVSNHYTLGMLEHGPYYADASRPDDSGDGTSWGTAKRTLQAAVDAAAWGDTVYVADGVYDAGGMVRHGQDFTNRVVIEKDIVVASVNGPEHAFIVGASDNGTNGYAAARCVFMSDGLLAGFTITNGHTQIEGGWGAYQRGGGVFLDGGGTVSNCIISGCSANITGGGVDFQYGGTVVDCTIEGNSAFVGGGGASLHRGALLDRCIVRDNRAIGAGNEDGGGLYFYSGGVARNCLIVGNAAADGGGGVYVRSGATPSLLENCTVADNTGGFGGGVYLNDGTNRNCIIYGNTSTAQQGENLELGDGDPRIEYCCLTPLPAGTGNIDRDPLFVDGEGDTPDYRLRTASPAANSGTNLSWMTTATDLAGQSRVHLGTVDMGAYEGTASAPPVPVGSPHALNITVIQNDTNDTSASVTLTASEVCRDVRLNLMDSSRGDYGVKIGDDPSDDPGRGILITCIRENGRDNGEAAPLNGTRYATSTMFPSGNNGYFAGVEVSPNGGEYNQNVAAAYFPFGEGWICGHATNAVNNGPVTGLNATAGLELGYEFVDNSNGTYTLAIPGVHSRRDGVLLVCGGRNEDNFALSKANANGSWTVCCHDNGYNGWTHERDPVAFAFVPTGMNDVVVGKFDAEGDVILGSGFEVVHTGTGTFELRIPRHLPDTGVLIVSPEGYESHNVDNIVTYEGSNGVWTIQTRDLSDSVTTPGLQNLPADQPVCSFAFFPSPMAAAGNALDFDGTNDHVRVEDSDALDLVTEYTLECWFQVDGFDRVLQGLIDKYHTPSANGYLLRVRDPGELDFDQLWTSGLGLQTGVWYHAAAVNDRGSRSLYVNGEAVPISGSVVPVQANTDPLLLGCDYLADGRFLDGRMDEVRIWNTARTEEEIRDGMHMALRGDESGLVAYYRCDYKGGDTLFDLTDSRLDGTLIDGPTWTGSTVPFADAIAGRSNIRGVWTVLPSSHASSRLSISNAVIAGADYALVGHDDGTDDWQGADCPSGIGSRLTRVWQLEVAGTVDDDIVIDTAGLRIAGNGSGLRLLRDGDGAFADAVAIAGSYAAGTFTVTGQALSNGLYCTLGLLPPCTITASAGAHGAIDPEGAVSVPYGGTTNFSMSPDAYYHVADVTTNGTSVGAVTGYTWSNVTVDGTIHATFAADRAARGTPHWWLAAHGWSNNFDAAETDNPDGDPHNNRQEYIADTDPTDSNDYFSIGGITVASPPVITFESSSNRLYSLQGRSTLITGDWSQITGKTGAGGTDSLSDSNQPPRGPFYRLEVELP